MTSFLTIIALLLSAVAAAYIAVTDPKRRRAFRQEQVTERTYLWPARLAILGPGVIFMLLGYWAAMVIWAGGVTVIGWGVAATSPIHIAQFKSWASEVQAALSARIADARSDVVARVKSANWSAGGRDAEIASLNERIRELEAKVSMLEGEEKPRISIAASGGNS
ncbi:MAG: hypothetical protein AAGE80_01090 [Pseudomonadota bacterium]